MFPFYDLDETQWSVYSHVMQKLPLLAIYFSGHVIHYHWRTHSMYVTFMMEFDLVICLSNINVSKVVVKLIFIWDPN